MREYGFGLRAKESVSLGAWISLIVCLLLTALGVSLTRAAQTNRTLTVSGHPGELAILEISGRSYVEIQALASLLNGALTIHGNRMVLTPPGSSESAPVPVPAAVQPVASGFSKDFLKAGIEEMSVIREWRTALTDAVQRGFPITEDWLNTYSTRARQSVAMASLAVSTDSGRSAFQLLTNVFSNMQQLSNRFSQMNKSMTYIAPNALNNDPLDQRILTCARALAAMAASNQFADDASCH